MISKLHQSAFWLRLYCRLNLFCLSTYEIWPAQAASRLVLIRTHPVYPMSDKYSIQIPAILSLRQGTCTCTSKMRESRENVRFCDSSQTSWKDANPGQKPFCSSKPSAHRCCASARILSMVRLTSLSASTRIVLTGALEVLLTRHTCACVP